VRKTDLYPQPLTQSDCEGRPTYQQDLEELTLLVAFEDQSVLVFSLKEHTLPLLVHFSSLSPQVDTWKHRTPFFSSFNSFKLYTLHKIYHVRNSLYNKEEEEENSNIYSNRSKYQ
jgi:hypothetical protein